VSIVGHGIGRAIALLDAVYLPLHLPKSIRFKTYTYGMPRVGNKAFADYVDSSASKISLSRITNRKVPIPIVPGSFVDYVHPSGEVHIDYPAGAWYSCPGQNNTSHYCEVGDVSKILVAEPWDHVGPYGSVAEMGCSQLATRDSEP
jgi:hypothetical protein